MFYSKLQQSGGLWEIQWTSKIDLQISRLQTRYAEVATTNLARKETSNTHGHEDVAVAIAFVSEGAELPRGLLVF
jgi:hypothetical protein